VTARIEETNDTRRRLEAELQEAEEKAWKALAGYKFAMFGYWAAIWVHLNRLGRFGRPNPFRDAVALARTHTSVTERKGEETKEPTLTGLFAAPADAAEDRQPEEATEESRG